MFEKILHKLRNRKASVDVLALCFGIGAWVAINGIWLELPLLVAELPEGWDLGSYMTLVIQLANIGPLAYSLLRFAKPSLSPTPVIYVVLLVGCASSLLLVFFWDETTTVNGEEHSLALLTFLFFLSLVDCTSSVLYFPYMAVWKQIYFSSYLIGEGLSGLLPAIMSLIQGAGGEGECVNVTLVNATGYETWHLQTEELEPNFSIEGFFMFIFAMMVLSASAFIALEFVPYIQSERSSCDGSLKSSREILRATETLQEHVRIDRRTFGMLLAILTWSCTLSNGFLPSIQAYSCAPYGNVAYHFAVTLAAMANPTAAFLTMILPRIQLKAIAGLAVLGTAFAAYITALAVMSPTPVLVDSTSGAVLMVCAWILFSGVITYVRCEISVHMREESAQSLFWSGLVTQVGAAIGAIVAFVLVNNTSIFTYYNPCE